MKTGVEQAAQFVKSAPKLREKDLEAINGRFRAYAFRRSRTREIWTTCCGKHVIMGNKPEETEILRCAHQGEKSRIYGLFQEPAARCPYCGKPVYVKELGRTGYRDNLYSERRVLVLRWYRGSLWATGYDCYKNYHYESSLTERPECKLVAAYRFRLGEVLETTRYWADWPFRYVAKITEGLKNGRWRISNPFPQNWEEGTAYSVVGIEEVQKSPLRYCMVEEYEKKHFSFVQFLTACCMYPRKIEMLMKAGMEDVVVDLVVRGVKHAEVIKWDQPEGKNIFGLNKQELKEFLATERKIGTLEIYKRTGKKYRMEECERWNKEFRDTRKALSICRKYQIPFAKLTRYLEDQTKGLERYSADGKLGMYEDYIHAASEMGYRMYRTDVMFPKFLRDAHDEATNKYQEKLAKEQEEIEKKKLREQDKKYQVRKKQLEQKYAFEMNGLMIRVPSSGAEIITEGGVLKHCVAGYAGRHVRGSVTILFMREAKKPDTPFLTIEMNGNQLVQIHGYRNEGIYTSQGRFAPDPREVYADFLDTWLEWLKKGSKRNKDGSPKLPRKKGNVA